MRASALALALVPLSHGAHGEADAGAAANDASNTHISVTPAPGLDDPTLQMLMSNPLVQRVLAYSARQVQTDPMWEAKFRDLQETARSPGGVEALVNRLQQSAPPPVRTLTARPPEWSPVPPRPFRPQASALSSAAPMYGAQYGAPSIGTTGPLRPIQQTQFSGAQYAPLYLQGSPPAPRMFSPVLGLSPGPNPGSAPKMPGPELGSARAPARGSARGSARGTARGPAPSLGAAMRDAMGGLGTAAARPPAPGAGAGSTGELDVGTSADGAAQRPKPVSMTPPAALRNRPDSLVPPGMTVEAQ